MVGRYPKRILELLLLLALDELLEDVDALVDPTLEAARERGVEREREGGRKRECVCVSMERASTARERLRGARHVLCRHLLGLHALEPLELVGDEVGSLVLDLGDEVLLLLSALGGVLHIALDLSAERGERERRNNCDEEPAW